MVTIAVVAPGAMGAAIGTRLVSHGAQVLTSLEGRSAATRARADLAGMIAADDAALAAADLILSIVPPNEALPLATRFAAAIARVGGTPIYVDLNAISPATARDVGAALAGCGARYVDGSIIGLPPKAEGVGPSLYLAETDGAAAGVLGQHGLVVKPLTGGVGAASALKMTYAGMTKGLTALGTAMILAAQREGAAEALAAEMASSQPELLARLRRAMPDMLPKAYRWVPEMEQIAAVLGPDDPASGIYASMAGLYERVAEDRAADGALGAALLGFFEA